MSFRVLLVIYSAALTIETFANLTQNTGLQSFSKPSLMLILMFYFLINARKLDFVKFLIAAALFFVARRRASVSRQNLQIVFYSWFVSISRAHIFDIV